MNVSVCISTTGALLDEYVNRIQLLYWSCPNQRRRLVINIGGGNLVSNIGGQKVWSQILRGKMKGKYIFRQHSKKI